MVCKPCQAGRHAYCPEAARRAKITRNRVILPLLDRLTVTAGQVCDCQHGGDSN
jgi:hypothetical protein